MKPLVFVVRMSAIGDCVIASRAVADLLWSGCRAVFVTSEALADVAASIRGIEFFVTLSDSGVLKCYRRKDVGGKRENFEETSLTAAFDKRPAFDVLDLHRTRRSARAIRSLRSSLQCRPQTKLNVAKRTLFRFFILFCSRLWFRQKTRDRKFDLQSVERISDLQRVVVSRYLSIRGLALQKQVEPALVPLPLNVDAPGPQQYIVVAPGASANLKAWPKEFHRKFIQSTLEQTQFAIVLIGGANETYVAEFLSFDDCSRVLNRVGQATLAETFALIANAAFVLSADSFAAHVADVFGVPGAMLFGATSPRFGFIPTGDSVRLLYSNLNCSPCTRHGSGECRFKNLRCLTSISVEEVSKILQAR